MPLKKIMKMEFASLVSTHVSRDVREEEITQPKDSNTI